jgi:ParB family chromosome partitioning protein
MSAKKRGLGRGLDALLATSQTGKSSGSELPEKQAELQKIPLEFLQPGKYQPRKDMSSEALEDLASSIRSQGIIQPIVVRQISEDNYCW